MQHAIATAGVYHLCMARRRAADGTLVATASGRVFAWYVRRVEVHALTDSGRGRFFAALQQLYKVPPREPAPYAPRHLSRSIPSHHNQSQRTVRTRSSPRKVTTAEGRASLDDDNGGFGYADKCIGRSRSSCASTSSRRAGSAMTSPRREGGAGDTHMTHDRYLVRGEDDGAPPRSSRRAAASSRDRCDHFHVSHIAIGLEFELALQASRRRRHKSSSSSRRVVVATRGRRVGQTIVENITMSVFDQKWTRLRARGPPSTSPQKRTGARWGVLLPTNSHS